MIKQSKRKAFIKNCLIDGRVGDELFITMMDGEAKVHLDGYAIIPLEKYQELTGEDFSDTIEKVGDNQE